MYMYIIIVIHVYMYYNALFLNSCNIIYHDMAIDFHYFQELTCISRKALILAIIIVQLSL